MFPYWFVSQCCLNHVSTCSKSKKRRQRLVLPSADINLIKFYEYNLSLTALRRRGAQMRPLRGQRSSDTPKQANHGWRCYLLPASFPERYLWLTKNRSSSFKDGSGVCIGSRVSRSCIVILLVFSMVGNFLAESDFLGVCRISMDWRKGSFKSCYCASRRWECNFTSLTRVSNWLPHESFERSFRCSRHSHGQIKYEQQSWRRWITSIKTPRSLKLIMQVVQSLVESPARWRFFRLHA